MTTIHDAFIGLSVIGNAFGKDGPEVWPFILSGHYDKELKAAFHIRTRGVDVELNLEDEGLNAHLNVFKRQIRNAVQGIIDAAVREEAANAVKLRQQIMNNLHSPSEFGTIAELVEKTGLSKSQIRKMKREGTLEQYLSENC